MKTDLTMPLNRCIGLNLLETWARVDIGKQYQVAQRRPTKRLNYGCVIRGSTIDDLSLIDLMEAI